MAEDLHTVIALNGGGPEFINEDTMLRVRTAFYQAQRINADKEGQSLKLGRLIMAGHDAANMYDYTMRYLMPEYPNAEIDVQYDSQSNDTIGNAHYTKLNLELTPSKDPHVHVVTVGWHAPRAKWIFERVLGPDFDIHTNSSANPYGMPRTAKALAKEFAAFGLAEKILWGVNSGDDEERERRLMSHPRYS